MDAKFVAVRGFFARLARSRPHWYWLGGILWVGLGLRWLGLAAKPLWVDEVITSVFALGRDFTDIPVDQVIPLPQLAAILTRQGGVSCGAIASHLASQSTHPPLFFCLLYQWLGLVLPWVDNLAWAMRSFAVVWGVGAIAALYWLNRVAFSPQAGLWGAGVMALSPFAVYLSQEARHYTFPMGLITVSLALQILLQRQWQQARSRLWLWSLWGVCHCLALYSHYFCLLAIAAQGLTFLLWLRRERLGVPWRGLGAAALPLLGFLPWLQILLAHSQSPKTSWLDPPIGLAPLAQTLAGWVVMFVSFPVERQPLGVQIGVAIAMLGCLSWLGYLVWPGIRHLQTTMPGQTLTLFTLITIGEFFFVIYGLQKDISIAPRYHFVYFPALCALGGAALGHAPPHRRPRLISTLILGVSSLCVVTNLAFPKPYDPDQVAAQFNADPAPITVMMAYHNTLEMAVGLSYGLAFADLQHRDNRQGASDRDNLILMAYTPELEGIWQKLATLPIQPQNLWVIAPGYYDNTYPDKAELSQGRICWRDRQELYRIGFPYQLYRCPPN